MQNQQRLPLGDSNTMKLKLTTFIIVTCFVGSAFAKIGDTEAKWLTRFPGTRLIARDTYKGHQRMAIQFPDGGNVVGVFVNNSCEFQTSFTPRTKSREPSSSDVEKVADQYGGNLDSWAFLPRNENYKEWVRPDKQLEIVVQKEQDGRWSLSTIAGPILAEFTGNNSASVDQNGAPAPDTTGKTPAEPITMAESEATPTPEPTSTPEPIATPKPTDAPIVAGFGLVLVMLVLATYFLPSIVACVRQKAEGGGGIFFVNLLLGWTVVGWFVAFIWACTGRTRTDIVREQTQHRELLAGITESNSLAALGRASSATPTKYG